MKVHLQPKQGQALDLIEATGPRVATIIGIGGAKGGGKSRFTRDSALTIAAKVGNKYPGIVSTIVRRVYKDLHDNHIEPLFREHPELLAQWRSGAETLEFRNKSKILFRYCQNEGDVKRKFLGGFQSALIFVDEAQQFSQVELQWIETARRWTDPQGIPEGLCKLVLLFNPGGVGSEFLRRIFWTKKYEGEERAHSYAFIHLFGWDNYEWFRGQVDIGEVAFYRLSSKARFELFITETSEGRKYNAFPLSIRAGYLLGSFDHFEGQYFAGVWDDARSTLSGPQESALIQYWHRRWMSFDWGYGHHFSVFWFASLRVSPRELQGILGVQSEYPLDLVICYRELIGRGLGENELGREICAHTPRAERQHISQFLAGADIFSQRRGIPHTIAQQIEQVTIPEGLPQFAGADTRPGSRVHSARLVHEMLRRTSSMRSPNPPQRREESALLLVGPECPQLQSALPKLICDDKNPEDIQKLETKEDDIWDGFKYGVGYWDEVRGKAPIEVRRAEVYRDYDVAREERTTDQMTALSMAVRKFDARAKREGRRIIRKR